MSSTNRLGLHLRLKDNLATLVEEATLLQLSCMQFFLVEQKTHQYLNFTAKDKQIFLQARQSFLKDVFIHSSYWINAASSKKDVFNLSRSLLRREIRTAKSLEIPYLVLHAGSSKGHPVTPEDPLAKVKGLQSLARMLNALLKKESDVTLLLENAAHGSKTLGNDLNDFVILKELLDHPEKIGFCLDTAHAYAYGYDLDPLDQFLAIVDQTMGLANLKLIHFNDSDNLFGSMLDKHAAPGQGNIGKKILSPFLHHKALKALPKIIEAPVGSRQTLHQIVESVNSW